MRQDALGESFLFSPTTICGQDKFPGLVVSETFSRWVYIAPGTYFKFGPFQTCREDFRVCLAEAVVLAVHRERTPGRSGAQKIFPSGEPKACPSLLKQRS